MTETAVPPVNQPSVEDDPLADWHPALVRRWTPTPTISDAAIDTSVAERCANLPLTAYGVAERVAAYCAGAFAATPTPGRGDMLDWHRWNGQRWAPVTQSVMRRAVLRVVRIAQRVEPRYLVLEPDASEEKTVRAARQHQDALRSFEKTRSEDDVIQQLALQDGVLVDADEWDKDSMLLNTPVGVIDLRTGARLPHDPSRRIRMITRGIGSDVPEVEPLSTLLAGYAESDPDIPKFVGGLAGVCCTGLSPALFSHHYGDGGTGKSTLWFALVAALGDYAQTVQAEVLGERRGSGGGPDPFLNKLRGKRLVYVDEAADRQLNADLIKTLTSGGFMTTRTHRGEPVTWRSHVTLVLSGNGPLRLPDLDDGIRRRFYPVQYYKLRGPERTDIERTLIETTDGWDSVLAWAVRNAVEWLSRDPSGSKEALNVPEVVRNERGEYLADLNPLAGWLNDGAAVEVLDEPVEDNSAPTTEEAHVAYVEWCRRHGIQRPITLKDFVARMAKDYGVTDRVRRRGGMRARYIDRLRLKVLPPTF